MTDAGRKPMSDSECPPDCAEAPFDTDYGLTVNLPTEISEHVTPDSTKSTQQKAKEGITDSADTVAR